MSEEKPKSMLDKAFEQFEIDTADCKVIRKEMIEQLRKDLPLARVTQGDKGMLIQAKMSMITTLNGMLKDVEDASLKKVKLQLSRTEQENNGQYSQAIVSLLKAIRADGQEARSEENRQDPAEVDAQLQAQAEKQGITLTDGETSACEGSFAAKQEEPKKEEEK